MSEIIEYNKIETLINYKFKNRQFLKEALTHSSYANEHRVRSNERLEFLGDTVLNMIVSTIIFSNNKLKEGDLSKLRAHIVSEKPLSIICDSLRLHNFLLRGAGEKKSNTLTESMRADLVEALIGAMYLDGGIDACKNFISVQFANIIDEMVKLNTLNDSKSYLQENFGVKNVVYKTRKYGEEHSPNFVTKVLINGEVCGKATAKSKKEAELLAANDAIKNISLR